VPSCSTQAHLGCFLLGDAQIVEALQIDPEFGTSAEEMRQAQRRIGGDVPASVQNLGDAIGWNLKLACQRGGAHVEFLQFRGQMFSGMDREQSGTGALELHLLILLAKKPSRSTSDVLS
jgi:hypothetical protein